MVRIWSQFLDVLRSVYYTASGGIEHAVLDEPLFPDVSRLRLLIEDSLSRSKNMQTKLRELHKRILIDQKRTRDDHNRETQQYWPWKDMDSVRHYDGICDTLIKVDHQRQEALGRIDGIINSLHFLYADMAAIETLPLAKSRHYRILQLWRSSQKLGRSSQSVDRGHPALERVVEVILKDQERRIAELESV